MKAFTTLKLSLLALLLLALAPLGSAWAQQIKVTSATPSSTYQGTVSLDVVIAGSGFDQTSQAQFFVTGTTNSGGVTVRKTTFHNSKEIVATIDVADTATVASFDVVVALDSGRKGKGTTLFAVQSKTSDPCVAVGLDFPAFAYRKQNANKSWTIYVADASGVCSRPIASTAYTPAPISFSYPVAGSSNRGRVTWRGDGGVIGVDFTVSGNFVSLDPPRTFYSPAGCCFADMSRDGQTLYFSLTDTVLATLDLSSGTASPVPFYTFVTTPYGAQRGSVNGDQTFLFLEEFEADSTTQLVRLTLPPAPVVRMVLPTYANGPFWVAANLDDNRIAFLEYAAGTNYCGQLVVTDSDGLSRQVYPNRFGKFATWLDGKVLMERESVDRRGDCALTGTISAVAPDNTETVLTNGTGPNGR